MTETPTPADRKAALDDLRKARIELERASAIQLQARKRRDAAVLRAVEAGATDAMLGQALLVTRQHAGQLARRAGAAARRVGRRRGTPEED